MITIYFNKEILADVVSKLKGATSKLATNPIISHMLFSIEGNEIEIKSSNGKFAYVWYSGKDEVDYKPNTPVEVFNLDPGNTLKNATFSIDATELGSLLHNIENSIVTMQFDVTNNTILLKSGKFEMTFSSGFILDFPKIVIPNAMKEISIPDDFSEYIKSIYFALSDDFKKPDLSSICVSINKIKEGYTYLLGTDRVRISSINLVVPNSEPYEFLIQKDSLAEIKKLCPNRLFYDEVSKRLFFKRIDTIGTYVFLTSLINCGFPNLTSFVLDPYDKLSQYSIEKNILIKVLKRIKVVNDKNIHFKVSKNNLVIHNQNSTGKKGQEILDFKSDLEFDFKVNIELLLEFLINLKDDNFNFKIMPKRCMIIDKDNFRHIISIT